MHIGELAAETVPPLLQGKLLHLIRVGVDVNRHGKAGELDRIGDGPLVAEVGQGYEDAVDFRAILPENPGARCRILPGRDDTVGRVFFRDGDDVDVSFLQFCEYLCAAPVLPVRPEKRRDFPR